MPGQADVEHHQVEVGRDRAWSRPAEPSPTTVGWCPSARRPLATNEAMRCLVLDDQDAGHWGPSLVMVSTKRAPVGALSSTRTVPEWASAMARTMDSPRPKPSSSERTLPRPKRSKIALALLGSHPGAGVAHPDGGDLVGDRGPDGDDVARVRVLDRVVGELEDRLGDALFVDDQTTRGAGIESPVPVAEHPRLGQQGSGEITQLHLGEGQEVGTVGSSRARSGRPRGATSGRPRPGAGHGSRASPRGRRPAARDGRAAPSAGS